MKPSYEHLLGVVQQSHRQAQRVGAVLRGAGRAAEQRLVEQLAEALSPVERVMSQARRRVIERVAVPAQEELVSLFEPHTRILKRGKAVSDVEFGRKVWLDEVEGGVISRYEVLEKPEQDYVASPLLPPGGTHTLLVERSHRSSPHLSHVQAHFLSAEADLLTPEVKHKKRQPSPCSRATPS